MTLIDANQTSKQCFKTCVNRQLIIYINMVPSGVLLAHKMHFLCVFSMNTISFLSLNLPFFLRMYGYYCTHCINPTLPLEVLTKTSHVYCNRTVPWGHWQVIIPSKVRIIKRPAKYQEDACWDSCIQRVDAFRLNITLVQTLANIFHYLSRYLNNLSESY